MDISNKDGDRVVFVGVELNKSDLVGGLWFLELTDRPDKRPVANITAILVETKDAFKFHWRMRLYMDDQVFNSKDMRMASFNTMTKSGNTRKDALVAAIEVVSKWCESWNTSAYFTEEGWCSIGNFFEKIADDPPPFMQVKKVERDSPEIPSDMRKRFHDGENPYKI